MTQSSVLERLKGKGAQLVPAALFPWSRPAAPSAQVSPGFTQDASTGQNSDDRQCHRDEAGGDTTLKKKINTAICGERDWISDLLAKKRDAAP